MGNRLLSILPVVVPGLVLVTAGVLMPLGDLPTVQAMEAGMGSTLLSVASASSPAANAASPAAAVEAQAMVPGVFAGNPQAYLIGLVAAAFLVGVTVITRGRFYP